MSSGEGRARDEAVRQRCLRAAIEGYQQAAMRGVCHEGAWEIALGAMRAVDLDVGPRPPVADLEGQVDALAAAFVGPGGPAAGSAAAATGAIAAAIVEWVAELAADRPGTAAMRADVARQAAGLRAELCAAAQSDAVAVNGWIAAVRESVVADRRSAAAEAATASVLDIARACARVAGLAADLATLGCPRARPDARAAVRLAVAAGESCLRLAESNLRGAGTGEGTTTRRRALWRLRLLLRRAQAADPEDGAEITRRCQPD